MRREHAKDQFWHARHDPDYGTPGIPENLACRACQKIWHARHAGDFADYELLITRT